MWWASMALAEIPTALPRVGEVPEPRLYAKVDEAGGRLSGRWRRRRDAAHELFELPDGLVIRWRETGDGFVLDHQRDAAGRAWATVRTAADLPVEVVVHGGTDVPVDVHGWTAQALPGGGAAWLPTGAVTTDGKTTLAVLGGTLEVSALPVVDPFAPAFVEGLLHGCACTLYDRSTAWVDGRPAVHHVLLVPDPTQLPGEGTADLVELWTVPRAGDTLLLSFRVRAPPDPVAASVTARVLPALVDLDWTAPAAGVAP